LFSAVIDFSLAIDCALRGYLLAPTGVFPYIVWAIHLATLHAFAIEWLVDAVSWRACLLLWV